jgi:putative transposon-encoded protein
MRKIKLMDNKLNIQDEIEVLFEKKVTKFGNGAKIDCPKEHIGKKVYILVRN